MPTVNVFFNNKVLESQLEVIALPLKEYVAKQLTCGDIKLKPNEVSLRFIATRGNGMLAPVEIEITAAAFKERVEKQDEICLNVQKFVLNKTNLADAKVWLILSELGHSWE